jgi:triphosphatase
MVRPMSETELKFIVDSGRAMAIEAALRRHGGRRVTIESRYLDTADRRLAEAGLSLRLRRTGRLWEQTLKAPGASAVDRAEETVARRGRWTAQGPPIEPALHAQSAAGQKLLALLQDEEGTGAALRSVYETEVSRLRGRIESEGAVVEVAFDRGAIRAEGRSAPICEVEYELVSGSVAALLRVARAGVVAHRMCLSTVSKAARGDRLARRQLGAPAVKARAPAIAAAMPGPILLRAVVEACVDQVLGNASELALGHLSDDLVHELRVGLRRLRTASRELGALDPLLDRRFEAAFANAFRGLGSYRDQTSVAAASERRLAAAGSPAQPRHSNAELPDPLEIVRAEPFQCALLEALAAVLAPSPSNAANRLLAVDPSLHIGARLDKLHRRLAQAAGRFESLVETERHRARKRVKRLRYLGELVAPLYKGKDIKRYVSRLKPAQDELGAYVDLVVSLKMARDAAIQGDAEAWFDVGWLTAQLAGSIKACRRVLARAAKAEPFWKS